MIYYHKLVLAHMSPFGDCASHFGGAVSKISI